jgi:hypothetical protein
MRFGTALRGGGLLVILLALTGCMDRLKMADVEGDVTVDNEPIEEGSITFIPADGKGPTTGGRIEDGHYAVKVPPGPMKVAITRPKVVEMKKLYPTPDSPKRPIYKETLPARFNDKTELRYEVEPGTNEKNFQLSTK